MIEINNKILNINGLTPPPRYNHCNFSSYLVNLEYPSQIAILKILQTAIKRLNAYVNSNSLNQFILRKKSLIRGIYLDGSFGVGKTHLLTSCFNEFKGKKIYFTFTDLMNLISYLGMETLVSQLSKTQLICIDEFELDDPGNTMKAGNFLRQMTGFDSFIITTSNTVPGELGKGRFAAEKFASEIGFIASVFKNYCILGDDYRFKKNDRLIKKKIEPNSSKILTLEELNEKLKTESIVFFDQWIKNYQSLIINRTFTLVYQDQALRFAHFIDKIYDLEIAVYLENDSLSSLFSDDYVNGAFQKKYKRCLSRLEELNNAYYI
jgi:cell division protein ZapE